jgi:pimeloyl-ACP methyl ester carboxylesterase
LDVYGRISRYIGPVQILHGDQDRLMPISYSEKAHEAYKNSSFKVMPGAGHGFRGEVQQEAIGIIKEFLY